ncbi:hypothetical protein ON010_g9915 [Phytophthora cinnamomi]|nr:hypothetical protein ON010_g9915 [Phytophthora cinnamomi]
MSLDGTCVESTGCYGGPCSITTVTSGLNSPCRFNTLITAVDSREATAPAPTSSPPVDTAKPAAPTLFKVATRPPTATLSPFANAVDDIVVAATDPPAIPLDVKLSAPRNGAIAAQMAVPTPAPTAAKVHSVALAAGAAGPKI